MKAKTLGCTVGVLLCGTCTQITVLPVAVEEVAVFPAEATVQIAETTAMTTELRGPDGELLTGRAIVWSSTDPTVAVVDSTGTATAMSQGQAIIVAESEGQVGTSLHVVLQPQEEGPPPKAPSNLNANDLGATSMALEWSDNSDNERVFEIQRRRSGRSWALIASPGANTTEHTDQGLSPNTEYEYRVRACNLTGCSKYSNRDKDKTDK